MLMDWKPGQVEQKRRSALCCLLYFNRFFLAGLQHLLGFSSMGLQLVWNSDSLKLWKGYVCFRLSPMPTSGHRSWAERAVNAPYFFYKGNADKLVGWTPAGELFTFFYFLLPCTIAWLAGRHLAAWKAQTSDAWQLGEGALWQFSQNPHLAISG